MSDIYDDPAMEAFISAGIQLLIMKYGGGDLKKADRILDKVEDMTKKARKFVPDLPDNGS